MHGIVGRGPYEAMAAAEPALTPSPVRLAFAPGEEPMPVGRSKRPKAGRRPSHAANDTRS